MSPPETPHSQECAHFQAGECRSCSLLQTLYSEQLKQKWSRLCDTLVHIVPDSASIRSVVPATPPFGSRYKSKLAVSGTALTPLLGFPKSNGDVQSIDTCPLLNPNLNIIAQALRKLISKFNLTPYRVDKRSGELKYIILKQSFTYSDVCVRFVLKGPQLRSQVIKLSADLCTAFPHIRTIALNYQPLPAAMVEGEKEEIIFGNGYISERLAGTELLFHSQSFSQVTPAVADKLYARAREHVARVAPSSVVDLYCGVGAFGLCASKGAYPLVGVEATPHAIAAAEASANKNGFQNTQFLAQPVEDYCRTARTVEGGTVIVNPPRRGLDQQTIDFIARSKAKQLIYSSCNPLSLRRDLQLLQPSYEVVEVEPFDMFPMTEHLEVLVTLTGRT